MPTPQDRDASVLTEADNSHKLTRPLIVVRATLFIEIGTYVPDMKDVTSTSGRDVVNVLVRFLPKSVTIGDAIKEIAARLRGVPGVRTIRFDELNGRPLTVGGKPVVF